MSVTVGRVKAAPIAVNGAQGLLLAVVVVAAAAGFLATDPAASAHMVRLDGASLTRLMRAMAMIKMALAALALAAMYWRLAVAPPVGWLAIPGRRWPWRRGRG